MTTTGINHFNLRAKRELLDELKEFYCTVVGLRDGERPPFRNFGYWLYAGDRPVVHLYEADPGEQRDAQAVSTVDHIAFDCTSLREVEAQLARLGVQYRAATVPATGRVQFFLKDPAGNGVELIFPASDD